MLTIKNIDDRLLDTVSEKAQANKNAKFRFMFRSLVSNHVSKSGTEAMEFVEVGLKLGIDEKDINLEDEEFKKLKEACDDNPLKWPDQVIGQLWKRLIEAEKENDKKKESEKDPAKKEAK